MQLADHMFLLAVILSSALLLALDRRNLSKSVFAVALIFCPKIFEARAQQAANTNLWSTAQCVGNGMIVTHVNANCDAVDGQRVAALRDKLNIYTGDACASNDVRFSAAQKLNLGKLFASFNAYQIESANALLQCNVDAHLAAKQSAINSMLKIKCIVDGERTRQFAPKQDASLEQPQDSLNTAIDLAPMGEKAKLLFKAANSLSDGDKINSIGAFADDLRSHWASTLSFAVTKSATDTVTGIPQLIVHLKALGTPGVTQLSSEDQRILNLLDKQLPLAISNKLLSALGQVECL